MCASSLKFFENLFGYIQISLRRVYVFIKAVITLTIGYNRAVNPRRFRCMDLRCESKLPKLNELLLLELATIAVRM